MRSMMSRHPWICAFIGHVLRRGMQTDPDSAFHTADSLYLESRHMAPETAADSVFGASEAVSVSRGGDLDLRRAFGPLR